MATCVCLTVTTEMERLTPGVGLDIISVKPGSIVPRKDSLTMGRSVLTNVRAMVITGGAILQMKAGTTAHLLTR